MLPRVISFFLIPLYTHYLVPDDYGLVELCGSIGLVAMTIMRFGVPGSVNRFYFDHKDNPEELRDYVTTIHRFLIFGSVSVALITGLIFYFFGEKLTPGLAFFPFVVIMLINNTFSANSDLQRRLLQSAEKSRYTVYLNLFNALIGIAMAIVFVVGFNMGALGIMLSSLVTTLVFFIQAQVYLRPYIKGVFRMDMLKSSLKYGLNTLPHLLFVLLAPLISKVFLLRANSMAALGIFSLANKFMQPLLIIYSAFSQAFNPIYFSLRKDNIEFSRIHKYFLLIWLVSCILYIFTLFLFPPLIPLITPERFHASAELIPLMATGFIWQIIYLLTVIDFFYLKKTKLIPFITLGGLLANILVTYFLVKSMGPQALAWAQFIGCLVWALIAKLIATREGEIAPTNAMLWRTFFLSLFCLSIEHFLLENDMLWQRALIAAATSAFLVFYFVIRDPQIFEIIKKLRSQKIERESKTLEEDNEIDEIL